MSTRRSRTLPGKRQTLESHLPEHRGELRKRSRQYWIDKASLVGADCERLAGAKRLDRFEAIIIDDIGYVQQDREEMEMLFTFLSARYERRSVMITSNLVFSQWEKIFKDPMTTACAIDRLVHHASKHMILVTTQHTKERATYSSLFAIQHRKSKDSYVPQSSRSITARVYSLLPYLFVKPLSIKNEML